VLKILEENKRCGMNNPWFAEGPQTASLFFPEAKAIHFTFIVIIWSTSSLCSTVVAVKIGR